MAILEVPLELKGHVYLVDRDVSIQDQLIGGLEPVARLNEVLSVRLGQNVHMGRKRNKTPSWTRITGDWIEIRATFVEMTQDFLTLMLNKRNDGILFAPHKQDYKYGHLFRAADYNAILIADADSPLDHPALFIPYVTTVDNGWFAHRAAELTSLAELEMTSVDEEGTDGSTYEYGDLAEFDTYPSEDAEAPSGVEIEEVL